MSWTDSLPRKYYEKYRRVELEDDWFEVYQLTDSVYAITEPKHFQEVNSFLIIGSERALQLDSGMAIGNIRRVAEQLYDGEILLVHCHFHFDHIADDRRYDRIYSFNEPHALKRLQCGLTPDELAFQMLNEAFWGAAPAWLDRDNYCIPPIQPIPIEDGHCFDLGDRVIEVLHTPGHTADSIMLLDRKDRLLFTGDLFYLGALYAQFHSEMLGYSDIRAYRDSLQRLLPLIPDLDWLVCSHNDLLAPPAYLQKTYDALEDILHGHARPEDDRDLGLHSHGQDGPAPLQFLFDGFSVLVNSVDYGSEG